MQVSQSRTKSKSVSRSLTPPDRGDRPLLSIKSFVRRCILLAAVATAIGCGKSDDDGLPTTMTLTVSTVSPTRTSLAWTEPSVRASDYRIYTNGAYLVTVFPQNGTSFTATRLSPDTTYCFRVYALYFPIGAGEKSNRACATTLHLQIDDGWTARSLASKELMKQLLMDAGATE